MRPPRRLFPRPATAIVLRAATMHASPALQTRAAPRCHAKGTQACSRAVLGRNKQRGRCAASVRHVPPGTLEISAVKGHVCAEGDAVPRRREEGARGPQLFGWLTGGGKRVHQRAPHPARARRESHATRRTSSLSPPPPSLRRADTKRARAVCCTVRERPAVTGAAVARLFPPAPPRSLRAARARLSVLATTFVLSAAGCRA